MKLFPDLQSVHIHGRNWNSKAVLPLVLMSATRIAKLQLMNMSARQSMDPGNFFWSKFLRKINFEYKSLVRDHSFKTSANFHDFWPLPPTIGIRAKCLWRGFLILMYCDLLTIGTWGHPSPPKTCWRLKWMVPKSLSLKYNIIFTNQITITFHGSKF